MSSIPSTPFKAPVRKRTTLAKRRQLLVAKVMRSAGRQIAAIDKRIGGSRAKPEQEARTLVLLVRSIRELTTKDAQMNAQKAEAAARRKPCRDKQDEEAPRDVEELRRSVTQKLDQIIAAREGGVSGEADLA